MISAIIIILYTFALIVVSYLYLKARYKLNETGNLKNILIKHIKYVLLTTIILIGIVTAELWYIFNSENAQLSVLLKWTTLFWGMYLLAKTDYHEKLIPNKVILVMLGIRVVLLAFEVFTNLEYWNTVLTYPALGAAIGGIIMAVAMLISRKGVGMGDVKMFVIIGAYVGSTEILSTMFYSFLISAIGGLFLLITRKAGLKDSVPMAPFAFAGVAVEYLLLMIGG